MEQSSLEEKVDLENLVLFPSESHERIEEEHLRYLLSLEPEELFKKYENFIIKDEPSENEINNDTSEKANELPDHKYEKSPIELPTNVKEQKIRDLFCFPCSLQFDGKSVYDLHLSLAHRIKDGSKSEDSEVKIEIDSKSAESTNDTKTSILPPVHEEKKKSSNEGNVHVEPVQKGKKPFKCNFCDKVFSQKQSLNGHIDSIHIGNKTFKCSVCDASFSQKQNLSRHIESVYEGKRPFKCNDCDKAFSLKTDVDRHIKSVHEGNKPFKCNDCSKAFSRKAHLNGHIESVHEGKKPFNSDILEDTTIEIISVVDDDETASDLVNVGAIEPGETTIDLVSDSSSESEVEVLEVVTSTTAAPGQESINAWARGLVSTSTLSTSTPSISTQACRPWWCRGCHGTPIFWQIS